MMKSHNGRYDPIMYISCCRVGKINELDLVYNRKREVMNNSNIFGSEL